VRVSNLHAFVAELPDGLTTPIYTGKLFMYGNPNPHEFELFASGGAGYLMSTVALRGFDDALTNSSRTCLYSSEKECPEDVAVSQCMRKAGVPPVDSVDVLRRERFHGYSPDTVFNVFTGPSNAWFLRHSANKIRWGLDCCSNVSVSFHRMAPEAIIQLHEQWGCDLPRPTGSD
jgi:hypothetical protein